MELRKLLSKFLTQICEKNYADADSSLQKIVEEKTKDIIRKTADKDKPKKVVKTVKSKGKFDPNTAYKVNKDGSKTKIPLNSDGSIKKVSKKGTK